jgi:hypothetical protein
MGINASVFSGPTNLMALGHPFCSPAYTDIPGIPFAIDIHSRELVCFDPWLLKDAGIINSAFGMILGPKNHGKSATLKILAGRLMLVSAGYQQMHVAINDYKPEGKASEYAEFSKAHGSRVFSIASMSVNPFEARLFQLSSTDTDAVYELGILGAAEVICEFEKHSPLTGHENTALRIALHTMLQKSQLLWSPHMLFKLLRSIDDEQITAYFNNLDQKLVSQLTERIERVRKLNNVSDGTLDGVISQLKQLAAAQDNHRYEDIKSAADTVSTYLGSALTGTYANMFGDKDSLYEMVTQDVATKDWRNVGPDAEKLFRILHTNIQVAAIESNRIDLVPHIELDDEKHKSMDSLISVKAHSFLSEIARGIHLCNLSATHRFSSVRRGDVGSELYNLGNTIINNLGFVLIGQQPDKPEILNEIQGLYSLSNADTQMLTVLPKYTFGMKLGESQKMRFLKVFATPFELGFLGSNAATDRMIDRPDVLNPADLQRFAEMNGIAYVGMN